MLNYIYLVVLALLGYEQTDYIPQKTFDTVCIYVTNHINTDYNLKVHKYQIQEDCANLYNYHLDKASK